MVTRRKINTTVEKAGDNPVYTRQQLALLELAKAANLDVSPVRNTTLDQLAKFAELVVAQHKIESRKEPSPFVSRAELIAAIEFAKTKKEVCVPSSDYYHRGNDWSTDEIEFISVYDLVDILTRGPVEE